MLPCLRQAPCYLSEAHRHNDVTVIFLTLVRHDGATVGIRDGQKNGFRFDDIEHIEYITDIETDRHLITIVGDIDRFLCFFLLRVVGNQGQDVFCKAETNTAVLFIGKNGRPLQCLFEFVPVGLENTAAGSRNDALVIRKAAINQLGCEERISLLETRMILAQCNAHFIVAVG